jgi:hypothetical protein
MYFYDGNSPIESRDRPSASTIHQAVSRIGESDACRSATVVV